MAEVTHQMTTLAYILQVWKIILFHFITYDIKPIHIVLGYLSRSLGTISAS